jgi:hypothetical protein
MNLPSLVLHQLRIIGTFCNNFQDSHNYLNSANVGDILVTPSKSGASGVATSALPNRSTNYYQIPITQPIAHFVQNPPGHYSLEYIYDQLAKLLRDRYMV